MKYLLTGMILLFGYNVMGQETGVAWETDMKKAAETALKENKPLFLFFTGSDWCGTCKRLQNEVFFQPQFHEWVKKNVVPVELDFPRNKQLDAQLQQQNNTMKEMFGVTGYPTIVFVTPTKSQNQLYYTRIGNLGYMAGGPDAWLNAASQYLPKKKGAD